MKRAKKKLISPKEIADKIYEEFDFKSPKDVDLELIANYEYIIVESADLEEGDGLIIYNKDGGIIKVNNLILDRGWFRFTVAHELGHFFHAKYSNELSKVIQVKTKLDSRSDKEGELFANEFASNLLMPERFYLDFMKNREPTINNFIELSKEFDVSLPAAAVRYTKLGEEPIAVIFSKNGYVEWKFESINFPFKYIRYGSSLPFKSAAFDLFLGSDKRMKNLVSSKDWYYAEHRSKKREEVLLIEESFKMDDNSILTILRLSRD